MPVILPNISFTIKEHIRVNVAQRGFWHKNTAEHAQKQQIRNQKGDTSI